jgi:hypothetical protein
MHSQQPIASLSFDLDNKWSYLKVHGDSGWEEFPSYLDILVPRVLEFLQQRNLHITFFVVGQDAAREENHNALRAIAAAGHEIGNHSFSHEPWLHLYHCERILHEIQSAEEWINEVTGQRPVGFRGPGFSISETALDMLEQRGYLYDASTWPTFFGPLARRYYFSHSSLDKLNRDSRSLLFGSFWEGLRPLKPYRRRRSDGLLEIPVTTMPFLRAPIHLSYLLYLGSFSPFLAENYFRTALALCRLTNTSPSLLLHPLDFLGQDDSIGLDFFPAMRLSSAQKLHFVDKMLEMYSREFQVASLIEYARYLGAVSKAGVAADCARHKLLLKGDL